MGKERANWALLESQIFHGNEIFLHFIGKCCMSHLDCFQSLFYKIPLVLASREAKREFNLSSFNIRINLPKIIYTQSSFKRAKLAPSLSSWGVKLQTPNTKLWCESLVLPNEKERQTVVFMGKLIKVSYTFPPSPMPSGGTDQHLSW